MYEIYKIKENDSLSNILNEYNITEEELININGEEVLLKIDTGNEIILPKKRNKNFDFYTVKKEDTIYKIANNNNMDYNLLLKINGLEKDDYIYPNQTILLPRKDNNMYLTKKNDTIKSLLNNLNIDINKLLEYNNDIYLEEEQIIIF
ncbi:MAG: LysM peptidoglycan-binding domain-containing protein [Bacilli bacterium]|nr:LysM peptidoglycan-binding domain-containing protein [Bacilli bacterium]